MRRKSRYYVFVGAIVMFILIFKRQHQKIKNKNNRLNVAIPRNNNQIKTINNKVYPTRLHPQGNNIQILASLWAHAIIAEEKITLQTKTDY